LLSLTDGLKTTIIFLLKYNTLRTQSQLFSYRASRAGGATGNARRFRKIFSTNVSSTDIVKIIYRRK
jgi:hypothetical protein